MYNIKEINQTIKSSVIYLTIPKAIHLVGHHLRTIYPNKSHEELYKHIKFKSSPNLTFPKSEISHIEFIEERGEIYVELEINFLSLFGSATPLPIHYAERVKDDFNDEQVLFDFLTLFNHHLQKLIYPIWTRQRYYVHYQEDLKDRFSKYLLSIIGLYPQSQEKKSTLNFHKLLPFLGILNMKPKSSETLASIIRHYIDYSNISIDECVVSRATIPEWQRNIIGNENSILGENLIIGEFTTIRNLKFRIHFNNIPWRYLYDYSFLGNNSNELKELISFALNEPLDYDIALNIDKNSIKKIYLNSDSDVFLGINSWIGDVSSDEQLLIGVN